MLTKKDHVTVYSSSLETSNFGKLLKEFGNCGMNWDLVVADEGRSNEVGQTKTLENPGSETKIVRGNLVSVYPV